jgi:hypothetical protein
MQRSRLVDLRPHPPHHSGMGRRRFLLTSLVGALADDRLHGFEPAENYRQEAQRQFPQFA